MKELTAQQRARAAKRAKDWVPYEAWVHKSNYGKLKTAVKCWQVYSSDMVMNVYPELSPEQRRFERLLVQYPRLYGYWDFDKRDCDIDALNKAMGTLSSGEQIMAAFFMSVWTGNGDTSFSIVAAAKTLDPEHCQVIADWLAAPFFP